MRAFAVILIAIAAAQISRAAAISESFSTDPLQRGWRVHGDASLFNWSAASQNLDVTWNSSRTNSYFYLPLGTILSGADDFSLSFDLRLRDIVIGTSANKPYTFQISIGFLRVTNATATNFFRGAGVSAFGPRNVVEFDYFPDSGFGATFAPTVASTNNAIVFSDNHPLTLTTGDLFHIEMAYVGSNRILSTTVLRNGAPYSAGTSNALKNLVLTTNQDFRVDALAVMNYSDAIQVGPPMFWGSVLAHGTVDNLNVTLPSLPVENLAIPRADPSTVQFTSRLRWMYLLERSTNILEWAAASAPAPGTGGTLTLRDTNGPAPGVFYRINANKP